MYKLSFIVLLKSNAIVYRDVSIYWCMMCIFTVQNIKNTFIIFLIKCHTIITKIIIIMFIAFLLL